MGHRNKKIVLRWEEVGYILFSLAAERGVTFLHPVSFCLAFLLLLWGFFLISFFPLNSESQALSSLVEIHQEIQKYLQDTD